MSNFAYVKYFADIIKPLVLSVVMLMAMGGVCGAQQRAPQNDSIEVGLLTCQSGQKVYSLYGHTAIRYHDLRTGEDWAFNYGVFNTRKPFFILRFVFGLTDYELGVLPMDVFRQEYTREAREVTEQVLNLTTEEKIQLKNALAENYEPQNRVYRYNYFYDNCTTRARDMIERCLNGKLRYDYPHSRIQDGESYRTLIHQHTKRHPWAALGNDLCLGFKADRPTDWRERQFLPDELRRDMAKAHIVDAGKTFPAVLQTRTVVEEGTQVVKSGFPLTPLECAIALFVATLAVCTVEIKSGKWLRLYDLLLMFVQGVAGIVVVALLVSEHPTTSTNLQVILLNPLPLFFIYAVARGRKTAWWSMSAVLSVLFFLGIILQDYAEGMVLVASSLLIRSICNEIRQRRHSLQKRQ